MSRRAWMLAILLDKETQEEAREAMRGPASTEVQAVNFDHAWLKAGGLNVGVENEISDRQSEDIS